MGLRIWLPLLNNLDNKGTSNFNITSVESSPTYVDGKIGKCYQRANSSSQLTNGLKIDNNLVDLFGSTASVTVWVKPLGTHTHYNGTILSSGNWNAKKWAFGVSQDNTKVDVLCGSYNNYITCAVPINEWTHLASIYDNGVCTLYKNGIYIGQLTGQAAFISDADWTGIGRETYAGGYFGFNGCIADLRVFDYCLSAAEVREISQGLVLHYKLDQANINLIPTNIFDSDPWKSAIAAHEIYEGRLAYRISNSILYSKTGTGQNDIFSESIVYQANTQYTLSITWRDDYRTDNKSSSLYLRFIYSDGSTQTQMISPANSIHEWVHQSIASTTGKTISKITTTYGNGGYLYITDLKLEVGALDTGMLYTDGSIEDNSGYNYNGTVIGDLITVKDTKRYSAATKWNSTDPTNSNETGICYIQTPISITTPLQLSFSWWAKPESGYGGGTGHAALCTSNKSSRPDDHNTTAFHHRDNGFDICPSDGSGSKRLSFTYTKNEWHHYALTYDGTTARAYKDGTETANVTIGTNKMLATFSQLYIGYSQAGGVRRKTLGTYSDFRMYVTALSTDAIRQLYEVGAKVDNKGNLHTFELNETNNGREILPLQLTTSYGNHINLWNSYDENGEITLTGGCSLGSPYIPINPSGKKYYFDAEISVEANNQIYLGFQRYDASKTARSNDATIYCVAIKPTTNLSHQHYHLVYDTAAAITSLTSNFGYLEQNVPVDTISFRILNDWSSANNRKMTIHNISLREVSALQNTKINKKGQAITTELIEMNDKFRVHKNGIIETNEIIEL